MKINLKEVYLEVKVKNELKKFHEEFANFPEDLQEELRSEYPLLFEGSGSGKAIGAGLLNIIDAVKSAGRKAKDWFSGSSATAVPPGKEVQFPDQKSIDAKAKAAATDVDPVSAQRGAETDKFIDGKRTFGNRKIQKTLDDTPRPGAGAGPGRKPTVPAQLEAPKDTPMEIIKDKKNNIRNIVGGAAALGGAALGTKIAADALQGSAGDSAAETATAGEQPPAKIQARLPQEQPEAPKPTEAPKKTSYEVKKGDNLWNIIKNKGKEAGKKMTNTEIANEVNRISKLNKMKNPDLIMPGQKIKFEETEVSINNNFLEAFNAVVSSKHPNVFQEAKASTPKTDKEKKLAALAEPKDKITHKDVLVGRGVVEEGDASEADTTSPSEMGIKKPTYGDNDHGVNRGKKEDMGSSKHKKNSPLPAKGKMITASYNKEEVEQIDELKLDDVPASRNVEDRRTGSKEGAEDSNLSKFEQMKQELRQKRSKLSPEELKNYKKPVKESIFSEAELAYFEAVGKPDDDYVGKAGGVNTGSRTGTLSDEYVEEGRRGRPPKGESLGANELHMNAKRAADNMDNVMHTFANGQKIRMTKSMGTGFMARHRAAKTPDAKDALLNHAHSSASAFKNVVEGKPVPAMKQKGISLAGKNYGDKS